MANVPFSGTPQVAPGGVPLSPYRADVNENTFGGNVGAAIHNLGGQLQKSGNELFERGVAMQTLYNQSEAQEADARYTEAAGKLHAEYGALSGKNAVDAYPKFIEDLKKTREGIRDGLSNETSQKLFESASNGTMGRSIFNGAGHAAGENKKYALGASKSRIGAIGDQVLSQPSDDRGFEAGMATTEAEVRAQANLMGLSEDETQEAISIQKSKLWSQRIQGMAKQDPMTAGKWLEDGVKKGDIRGEDIAKLTNVVQQQRATVGARMIAKQVSTGEGSRIAESIVPMDQAKYAVSQQESGGRYDLIGREVTDKSGNTGHALGKYQVMSYNLAPWLKEAGMAPMSEKEFLKSPSAQDQLFEFKFGGYMQKFGSFAAAAVAWHAGPGSVGGDTSKMADINMSTKQYVANVSSILARNAPLDTKIREGNRIAADTVPDDTLFPDYVEQRIRSDHERNVAIKRDTEFRNRQVVETALMGGESGKLPTTIEELTSTPESAQAWQDLLPQNRRRYMNVLAGNAKGEVTWNDQSLRQYQRLKGQANSDPAEFLDMDVVSMDLPNSAKRELINLQGRLKGKAEGDPRVAKALGVLAPQLQSAGIDKKDKDTYYQFVGALEDALKDYAEENKKPPKAEDIKLIGSRLLTQQTTEGWLWNGKTPTFQVPVPKDEAAIIKTDPAWGRLGITPTDQQIQRIYTQDLYKRLFGKASGSPGTPVPPPAPMSQ